MPHTDLPEMPLPTLREGSITAIQTQRRDPNRVSIFLDGAFAFGLNMELAHRNALEKGQVLSIARQTELLEAEQTLKAKAIALDYIAYRARAIQEVHKHLRSKGFSEAVAEAVIARCQELGYLNDAQYARHYTNTRLRNKGYGPRRIEQELRRRGVSSEHIEDAIAHTTEQISPFDSALRMGEKRWNRIQKETNPLKRRKKLHDYLLRRGFDYDTINAVYQELQQREDS